MSGRKIQVLNCANVRDKSSQFYINLNLLGGTLSISQYCDLGDLSNNWPFAVFLGYVRLYEIVSVDGLDALFETLCPLAQLVSDDFPIGLDYMVYIVVRLGCK